jgi:RNA polymerase sigma-70 factor (ECF subfamily)
MDNSNPALDQFDDHRVRLTAIARRMLGSNADADGAVQEAWLRVQRSNTAGIDNIGGWLTTVTARICLNVLRSRKTRRTDPLDAFDGRLYVDCDDPESEASLADSVSIALLVVLEKLEPAERLAFVLHDLFAMKFDEISKILQRSPAATRQLASRARRQVRSEQTEARSVRLGDQRHVVNAFFAAARGGDLDGLIGLLHPDLVLRSDGGDSQPAATGIVRGARQVAGRAVRFAQPDAELVPVVINGEVGVLATRGGERISLMVFTIHNALITAIDSLVDSPRLAQLELVTM